MKNSKMTKKGWLIIAAAILVIAVIVVISISTKQNQTTVEPTDTFVADQTLESAGEAEQTEASQFVHVETLNYELAFNAQLAEKVFYREIPDTAEDDLEFYTKINDQEYAVFTLVFGSAEGDIVHMIDDAAGDKVPVAFMMNTLPEGLDDEAADEFYISQGVVNEVVASIKMN